MKTTVSVLIALVLPNYNCVFNQRENPIVLSAETASYYDIPPTDVPTLIVFRDLPGDDRSTYMELSFHSRDESGYPVGLIYCRWVVNGNPAGRCYMPGRYVGNDGCHNGCCHQQCDVVCGKTLYSMRGEDLPPEAPCSSCGKECTPQVWKFEDDKQERLVSYCEGFHESRGRGCCHNPGKSE